jgi:putative spermidine/putrescine transport system substrate-binding protein
MRNSFWGIKCLIGAVAVCAMLAGTAQARDFTIASWGGSYQEAQRKYYFEPFKKAEGINYLEDTYLGGWAQFQAMQETGKIKWDVVQVETSELMRGCEEGVFVSLDWSKIGPKSELLPDAISECGVGMLVWSVIIAYNGDKVKKEPVKLTDFWDTKTWPGKRGMRKGPKLNLELALMADGVAPKDVYKVLAKRAGIDRAFRKLDQIKPLVQWWEAGAQAPEWLAAGDVELSVAYNGRITNAQKEGKNLKMIWDNTIFAIDSWAIIKGAPETEMGYKFIKFAVDPGRQADFTNAYAYGPTKVAAAKLIAPAQLKELPAGDNLKTGLFGGSKESMDFWVDFQEELTERWNVWVAKN